jgi:hypothetical protein
LQVFCYEYQASLPGVALEKIISLIEGDDTVTAGGDIEFDCYMPAIIHMVDLF